MVNGRRGLCWNWQWALRAPGTKRHIVVKLYTKPNVYAHRDTRREWEVQGKRERTERLFQTSFCVHKSLANFNNNKLTFTPAHAAPPKNTNSYTYPISHRISDKSVGWDKLKLQILRVLAWKYKLVANLHRYPLALFVHVAERTDVANSIRQNVCHFHI